MGRQDLLLKNWHLFVLLGVVLLAFWFRSFPARFGELQALDPFQIYRMSEYVLTHNWRLPENDPMRYYPFGVNPWEQMYMLPIYLPAFVYVCTGWFLGMHYLHFAIIFPAVMGTLAVLSMYLFTSELFGSKYTGLMSAFFLATIPAYITRTSAGFFEKEPIGGFFMITALWLFVKAFKKDSWVYGILSGLSLAMMSFAWGGIQYIYLLFGAFFMTLFIGYTLCITLEYLGLKLKKPLEKLDRDFLGKRMVKAYLPMIILGTVLQQVFPHSIPITSSSILISYMVLVFLLIKNLVVQFNLVKKEQERYVIPGLLLFGVVFILIGAMFFDFVMNIIQSVMRFVTLSKDVVGSTVAENAPGDWSNIYTMTGASFSGQIMPFLNPIAFYLSVWVFMFLGLVLLVYRFFRTSDWFMLFPILWLLTSIWGVFYYVRLVFLLGVSSSVVAGFFASWIIERFPFRAKKLLKINNRILTGIVLVFVVLLVLVNAANAYVYSLNLGPSICFPRYNDPKNPFDVTPCIRIENNTLILDGTQPWYQALEFLKKNTTDNAVVLSWWDFGYWFQTRGNTTSMADGGNLGGIYGDRDFHIAEWYTSPASLWDGENRTLEDWFPYLKGKNYTMYILMDYTLPGKYGAISKIASRGEKIVGFLQFQQTGAHQGDNKTIFELSNGPYTILLPVDDNMNIVGTPVFVISQNGKYYSKSYINYICTKHGIVQIGNQTPSIPGCITISDIGVYYVPEEAMDTVFTDLMFMDGYGLPVEKVFDNRLIKIYKVIE
ncbi:MAG: hypothetical protein DRP15_00600 [Candidatus Aenigmatarchaeota archaeon]|nr:MAG: hypothetical protein DRP15_00600 [Candidatus Aenigmarchaeota archaeon]